MERIICLAIGYLFGMFQTSYIIGKVPSHGYPPVRKRQCGNHQCPSYPGQKGRSDDPDRGHAEMRDRHSGGGRGFQKSVRGYPARCLACTRQQAASLDIIFPIYLGIQRGKGNCSFRRNAPCPGLESVSDLRCGLYRACGGHPLCVPGLHGGLCRGADLFYRLWRSRKLRHGSCPMRWRWT